MKSETNKFPQLVKRGSVTVKIYRSKQADTKEGFVYTVAYSIQGRRKLIRRADYESARLEAVTKAEQLAAGKLGAADTLTAEDGSVLVEARSLCGDIPLLAALGEWAKARKLCRGSILPAAEAWAARNVKKFERITLGDAVERFINSKERAGHEGERTYRSKLDTLKNSIGAETYLDAITTFELQTYLERFADGVTRNDMRKRAVTLWRWARNTNLLPEGTSLAIERTMRAKEIGGEIGIISAETFARLLNVVRRKHPKYLAPVVIAGFCGVRADEIHGKRADRSRRQTWEDVHLDRKFMRVTVAKEKTPAWRHIPLCDAAVEWLMLCPNRTGPVCDQGAMEYFRRIAKEEGFSLPENAFRHSFISHRIAVTQNKAQVALEAGNSVSQIDRHYRRPLTEEEGRHWFSITPKTAEDSKVIRLA